MQWDECLKALLLLEQRSRCFKLYTAKGTVGTIPCITSIICWLFVLAHGVAGGPLLSGGKGLGTLPSNHYSFLVLSLGSPSVSWQQLDSSLWSLYGCFAAPDVVENMLRRGKVGFCHPRLDFRLLLGGSGYKAGLGLFCRWYQKIFLHLLHFASTLQSGWKSLMGLGHCLFICLHFKTIVSYCLFCGPPVCCTNSTMHHVHSIISMP